MLLISYILAAALELAICMWAVKDGQSLLIWSYGFLLLSSAASIPLESGEAGKQLRQEMKKNGLRIDWYDMSSNVLRSVVYICVLFSVISPVRGALLAYSIAVITLILAIRKMK